MNETNIYKHNMIIKLVFVAKKSSWKTGKIIKKFWLGGIDMSLFSKILGKKSI